jgi:putative PIN family toxin of toxin-antitoxin system
VLDAFARGRFVLVTSEPPLAEVRRVLSRPRRARRYRIDDADIDELVALLRMRAVIVAPPGNLRLCRDPDDDIVIETALVGRAGFVVTRDDDLRGAPEVVAYLEDLGIPVHSVRRVLAEIAEPA